MFSFHFYEAMCVCHWTFRYWLFQFSWMISFTVGMWVFQWDFHCRHMSFDFAIFLIVLFSVFMYSIHWISVCYSVLYKSVYSVLFIVFWCSFYWAFQFHVYISVSISLKGMCAYQSLKHLQDLHRYIQTIFSH